MLLTVPSVHPFLTSLLTEHTHGHAPPEPPSAHSWPTIIEDALAQRVAPLLLHRLDHPARRYQIPLHHLTLLKQQVAQHAAWNLLLAKELRVILALCTQYGIACIPIRGPVFTEQLHGASSIRQMDDLDLLVHHQDLSTVKDIFQQQGYAHHEHRSGFHETYSYSFEFIHPHHGLVVEPHWTLAYPPCRNPASMEPVWKRALRQGWMNMDIWALSQEDLLLHLCLHLHHKGEQASLLWFYELDAVVRRHGSTLDWTVFMNQTRLMEQAGAVTTVLTALKNELISPIPDFVVRRLTEHTHSSSRHSCLATRTQLLSQSSLNGREEFVVLCSLQSLPQRLHYVTALVFPSPRYMARRYGASTRTGLLGFYIVRACRIGADGVRYAITWLIRIIATRHRRSSNLSA